MEYPWFALGMREFCLCWACTLISCCLCQFLSRWVANINAFFGGIWAQRFFVFFDQILMICFNIDDLFTKEMVENVNLKQIIAKKI